MKTIQQFLKWLQRLFKFNKKTVTKTYEIPYLPKSQTGVPIVEPEKFKPTKAYADQRQKSKRRRHRKPRKAMANLYRLKG